MGLVRRSHGKPRRMRARGRDDPWFYTPAGEVTIRRPDGSSEVQPALEPRAYQEVVRERWSIPLGVRQRVLLRDHGRCRYCGSEDGLELDHIVPIALGGSNRISNLATSCHACNSSKGTSVWHPRRIMP